MRSLWLRIQAAGDVAARQITVLRQTWRYRGELASPDLRPLEAQFLPAALELQETPPPAAARVVVWSLVLFVIAAVCWSILGQIDVVSTAQGKLVPTDRVKTIQPIEAGRVRSIHVIDGQFVRRGDILVELDDSNEQADWEGMSSGLEGANLQIARGRSMLAAINSGARPSLPPITTVIKGRWQDESQLLQGEFDEYVTKLDRIDAQIEERTAELQVATDLANMFERTASIARQRAEDLSRLAEQQLVSKHDFLLQEQERVELESQLAAQRSKVLSTRASVREAQAERTEVIAETQRQALQNVSQGLQLAATAQNQLSRAETKRSQTVLRAPVDGTVQQLAVHTVGGVVTQAQPLMVLVPNEQSLEVEAFLDNKDVGFVRPGQPVEIKIETFQFTKYGTIPGSVLNISSDAVSDPQHRLVYAARISLSQTFMLVEGRQVNLIPGMATSAEIRTGRRRLIEYFLSPVLTGLRESFGER